MYEPEVDDYVIWKRPNGDIEEGWVYFKGDPVDNEKRIKDGWKVLSRYITIETGIKPKPKCRYSVNEHHKFIHTLLLCHHWCWHELVYVKSRESADPQHYSECDN